MTDPENRFNILHELREDGFIIDMDDFGSGYSLLNMLKDMPVDDFEKNVLRVVLLQG